MLRSERHDNVESGCAKRLLGGYLGSILVGGGATGLGFLLLKIPGILPKHRFLLNEGSLTKKSKKL